MNRKVQHDISRRLNVLNYTKEIGYISKNCRYFEICRKHLIHGNAHMRGMDKRYVGSKLCPENHNLRVPHSPEEKIVYLCKTHHFGSDVIVWSLQRYHNIKISNNGCYQVLQSIRPKYYIHAWFAILLKYSFRSKSSLYVP